MPADRPSLLGPGILLGAGAFNLYDGTIQHKLLGLHQVRADAPKQPPLPHHRRHRHPCRRPPPPPGPPAPG